MEQSCTGVPITCTRKCPSQPMCWQSSRNRKPCGGGKSLFRALTRQFQTLSLIQHFLHFFFGGGPRILDDRKCSHLIITLTWKNGCHAKQDRHFAGVLPFFKNQTNKKKKIVIKNTSVFHSLLSWHETVSDGTHIQPNRQPPLVV